MARKHQKKSALPADLKATISGFRGIVGETLTPETAVRIAAAYARSVGRGRVALGRDGRPSGAVLSDVIRGTLCAAGLDVVDLGVIPTPTVGMFIRERNCRGGVMITASHNPKPWNGIKFFTRRGVFPGPDDFAALMKLVEEEPEFVPWSKVGQIWIDRDPVGVHLKKVVDFVRRRKIQGKKLRVAIDGCRSSGSLILPRLCASLGCRVFPYDCEPDGNFTRPLEPTPKHLKAFSEFVKKSKVQAGFAVDPDADRLVLVDENGECLNEELTLALAADHLLSRLPGPLVANNSSSMVLEDVAARHGRKVFRSPTGEAHVVEEIGRRRAKIGGEGNGGVIVPEVHPGRDAAVGVAVVLEGLASRMESLSEWADSLPQYEIVKRKVNVKPGAWNAIKKEIRKYYTGRKIDTTDGIKVQGDGWWVLVRPSNTEPIVRVSAEAESRRTATDMAKEAEGVVAG